MRAARLMATCVGVILLAPALVSSAHSNPGATATFALPPGTSPSYILPFMAAADESNVNIDQFQELMWRPLYWFGEGGRPVFNPRLSVGEAPRFSNHGRTVTIRLKPYRWSDGRPVSSRDIRFWLDLMIADRGDWYAYAPGGIPDNIVAMRFPAADPMQFSLTFDRAYNPRWLLYNQLSEIFPIPQHAWDRTSLGGASGNFDETPAGARAVYRFLDAESRAVATYTSDPLWRVVDGPWRLAAHSAATGYTRFVPNPAYSGPDRPRLAAFEEIPFTSDAAEFDDLSSGALDYGYLPPQDLSQRRALARRGYRFAPWPFWAFNAITINFSNPSDRHIVGQLYLRQALQRQIDQPAIVRHILRGYGAPNYGPVPLTPPNPYVDATERDSPYSYDPAAARRLLAAHGWAIHPGGTDRCLRAGAGARDCGAGIPRGAGLSFPFQYPTGSVSSAQEAQAIASAWSEAGIATQLSSLPPASLVSEDIPCQPRTGIGCRWSLELYSSVFDWSYNPDYLPTGEEILESGAASNFGAYSDRSMNRDIVATQLSAAPAVLDRYETYAALQLPLLWIPSAPLQLSEIRDRLHGTQPQDPVEQIYPETWTLGA